MIRNSVVENSDIVDLALHVLNPQQEQQVACDITSGNEQQCECKFQGVWLSVRAGCVL